MDNRKLFLFSLLTIPVFMLIFLLIVIRLINKYVVFQHYVIIKTTDGKPVQTIEKFDTVVSDVKNPILPKQQIASECNSLTNNHSCGTETTKPFELLCKNKQTNDAMTDYYSKNIKPEPVSATDNLPAMHNSQTDEDRPEIKGANYMLFNSNPNPYYLDYNLFDPNEKKNTPVGVNYINDV
jgi:hypothetical protein